MLSEVGIQVVSVCPSLGSAATPTRHCGCRNHLGGGGATWARGCGRQAASWFLSPGVWAVASLTATLATMSHLELWKLIPKHTAPCICYWEPSVQPLPTFQGPAS